MLKSGWEKLKKWVGKWGFTRLMCGVKSCTRFFAVEIHGVLQKVLQKIDPKGEEYAILKKYTELVNAISEQTKLVKELNLLLEEKVKGKYALLTDEEILELLVNRKWYYSIFEGIKALYVTASHNMANRIIELAERYEYDLPWLAKEAEALEAKVKAHLERMGFAW